MLLLLLLLLLLPPLPDCPAPPPRRCGFPPVRRSAADASAAAAVAVGGIIGSIGEGFAKLLGGGESPMDRIFKFLVLLFLVASCSPIKLVTDKNEQYDVTIYRDSTNIGVGTKNCFVDVHNDNAQGRYGSASMQVLDSPSTTSAITYTIYYYTGNSTAVYLNLSLIHI